MTDEKEEMVLMPKWRTIEFGAMPVKEFGQTVSWVDPQVIQKQHCVPPPVPHTVQVSQCSQPREPHPGYDQGRGMIRYIRVKVLKPGGDGDVRIEQLENTRSWNC